MDEHGCGNCKWWDADGEYCDRSINCPEWLEVILNDNFGHWGLDQFRRRESGDGFDCVVWESVDE